MSYALEGGEEPCFPNESKAFGPVGDSGRVTSYCFSHAEVRPLSAHRSSARQNENIAE